MYQQIMDVLIRKASPLRQCLSRHFDAFGEGYEERYQTRIPIYPLS